MVLPPVGYIAGFYKELPCPAILFGSTPDTKKNWKKLAKRAWKERDWGVCEGLELMDVRKTCDGIIMRNDQDGIKWSTDKIRRGFWSTLSGKNLWQLNWISEEQPLSYEDRLNLPLEHLDFIKTGMVFPWFTIGMFDWNFGQTFGISKLFNSEQGKKPLLEILRILVSAMGLCLSVCDRFYRNGSGLMLPYEGNKFFVTFLKMLLWAKLLPETTWVQDSQKMEIWEMLARLLEKKILTFDGTSFYPTF